MSRFNWWRRSKKKAPLQKKEALQGRSFLLQQIEHGDFDPSDYRRQAKHELHLLKQEQNKLIKSWIAGPESLKHRLDEVERKYIKRYNKLMEDDFEEERRLLRNLREGLIKEFEVDCWNESLQADPNQDLITLYNNYKKLASKQKK
jgi:hypothetical protein